MGRLRNCRRAAQVRKGERIRGWRSLRSCDGAVRVEEMSRLKKLEETVREGRERS
jgi:hypothetical protein